jgi:hypothetical protein
VYSPLFLCVFILTKERKYPKPEERQSTYKVEKGGTPFSLRIYEKMVWISYTTLN